MAKVRALRAMIYARYDSEAQLANELNWPRQRLNLITNGAKEPDLGEVKALSEKLNCPLGEMVNIFLTQESPNEPQE